MFSIRRQFVAGIMAVTLFGFASATAQAQPEPVGSGPSGGGQAPAPKPIVFTKESLPQMLKELGYTVTEKSIGNGRVYWQVVAQAGDWRFTVQVLPMVRQDQNQEKITSLLLSSDLGRKISPQTGAQDLLKLLQWNHENAYIQYLAYNAQSGCITFQRPYMFPDATPDEMRRLFEDFFKCTRETYALWNSLSGGAAAPAGNGAPAPAGNAQPPVKAATVQNIAGSTWTGNENLPGYGKLTFVFRANGATMIDAKGETQGTWTQNGADVTIRFDGCVYQGRINGQTLSGSGQITAGQQQGQTWTFQVSLQKS